MKLALEGILKKPDTKEKYWGVGVPLLEIYTQGKTKAAALASIKEAIESAIDQKGVQIEIDLTGEDTFALSAKNFTVLLAFMLKQQRTSKELSLRDAARKMGSESPNTFARYEQGKSTTSLEKLVELMGAVSDEKFLLLKTG